MVLKTQLGTACGPPTSNCTALHVEANMVQIVIRFICCMKQSKAKQFQPDLRCNGRKQKWKVLQCGHFYISFRALFSLSFSQYFLLSSPVLFPNPVRCQLNSWPKVLFFWSHFGKIFPQLYSPTLLHCWPNPVSSLSAAICFRTEEKLCSKRRHSEKEHYTESHSSGFLIRVIEFGCAFSN